MHWGLAGTGCGRCHCALQGKDGCPEYIEEMLMSSSEQPEGLQVEGDAVCNWGGEMSGECPVQLANKNLKGTKSFQETTIRNVYSFDWDCIKRITLLTAAEICPMHSLKEHTTTLSDCYVFAIQFYLILVNMFLTVCLFTWNELNVIVLKWWF